MFIIFPCLRAKEIFASLLTLTLDPFKKFLFPPFVVILRKVTKYMKAWKTWQSHHHLREKSWLILLGNRSGVCKVNFKTHSKPSEFLLDFWKRMCLKEILSTFAKKNHLIYSYFIFPLSFQSQHFHALCYLIEYICIYIHWDSFRKKVSNWFVITPYKFSLVIEGS